MIYLPRQRSLMGFEHPEVSEGIASSPPEWYNLKTSFEVLSRNKFVLPLCNNASCSSSEALQY
jgi:hypothetical protein